MLTVNTITDFFVSDVSVKVEENKVGLRLNNPEADSEARALIFSLENHLKLLADDYGGISLIVRDIS